MEYITKLMLLPTKVVLINLEGFFTKGISRFAMLSPCLLFNCNLSLFDEINAISIPEKKAQAIKVINIMMKLSKYFY